MNIFKISILFVFLIIFETVIGYPQVSPWYRVWNADGRNSDGKIVIQTYDSGYAILSQVSLFSVGNVCFKLVKYDNAGNLLFANLISDSLDISRNLYEFIQTPDSGFIFAGESHGPLLIRTDKFGNVIWQKKYTNFGSYSIFSDVKHTFDKGYIACGYNYISPGEKAIIVKTDSLGNIQWAKQFNDSLANEFGSVIQDSLSNFFVSGIIYNSTDRLWGIIKKLDSNGNQITSTIYAQNTGGLQILYHGGNNIFIIGERGNSLYPTLAKLDTSCNVIWVKNYTFPKFEYACLDKFNNIIICGYYSPGGYFPTIGLIKIDASGNVKDSTTFQYSGYNAIYSSCINTTYDLGFIICGAVGTGDSLIILHSTTLLIKTDSVFNHPIITYIKNEQNQIANEFILKQNYPNPFNPVTKINFAIPKAGLVTIKIYDILGREVSRIVNEFKAAGTYTIDFNADRLSSGVYFYRMETGGFSDIKKMMLLK